MRGGGRCGFFPGMTLTNAPRKPADAARKDIAQRVEAEMTRLLYRSAGFGLYSNFVLALVLAAGVWSYFPASMVMAWLPPWFMDPVIGQPSGSCLTFRLARRSCAPGR